MKTELLYKYLTGVCTESEEEEIEDWLKQSPENRKKMSDLKKILEVSPGKMIHVDSEKAWDSFSHTHLGQKKTFQKRIPARKPAFNNRIDRKKSNSLRYFAYVAAAAVLVIISSLFYAQTSTVQETVSQELVSQEITTQRGQRTTVRLSDGTLIHLNAESKLSVPQDYMKNNRLIRLNGEAFFEVTPNKEKPFIVQTGKSVTRVLGTKFNVTAYPDAEQVQVVVAEGKVAFGAKDDVDTPEVQLTKKQRGVINEKGEVMASNITDLGLYLDWSRGLLTFKDAPLEEVEKKLERWYDVQITFDKNISNEDRRLTGSFKDVSMTSVFNSIALSLDLKYAEDGREIAFSAR
ncbi:FecR family protein [Gracilimonas mengyeensis]|uniref:FecR family protein n=1 Tax=Gracilimonas mengyeensis TaxID=1302730 RepID=A0A521B1R3_9BACT|nr:FecR domain-containing protein [Gracilimonas mengyeensis]SMO40955.1 FecR family protein [Gracilimonas mengyeensis]